MSRRLLDRCVAAAVFGAALLLYGSTVAPTAAFWDTGEFIASAHTLQVNHPPGAPLYLLIGHLASLLVPPAHVALAVNLVSVGASALTVLLAHLIVARLVRRGRSEETQGWTEEAQGWTEELPAQGGGAVGALTFAATDSFWFNAVEAEVYALAAFLTALACWLALRWDAQVEEDAFRGRDPWATLSAHRHLVLIALVFGLAIGVHLLSLLAFFFVGVVVYARAVERDAWSPQKRWSMRVVAAGVLGALFLLIYPGVVKGVPQLIDATGAPLLVLTGLAGAVGGALYFTAQWNWARAHLATLCVAAILVGYSSYALVPLRSATDPPIDIGNPETTEALVSYLNRAQYGSTPLLSGRTFNDETGRVSRRGESSLFPRRHSPDPQHWQVYKQYESDWAFFWDYQVGHMYGRYLLWNFAGKSSDTRNAPAWTGLPVLDASTQPVNQALRTPSEKESRNAYYLLPLLLGLFGAVYHFSRDERRALAVLALFLATGLGIVLYLNQTPMQPRPRDYSFVGNFFAVGLWVGLGAAGLLESLKTGLRSLRAQSPAVQAASGVVLTVLIVAVPGQMLSENYADHDRSGRQAARDAAHNMLTSVAEDSILFTYGDNDTYPLWYLQNVEGVRPDVRVVNLSLLGTPWYAKQLKEPSLASAPVPMSLSDEQIERLRYRKWNPREVQIPVRKSALLSNQPALRKAITEQHPLETPMSWRLEGQSVRGTDNLLSPTNQVVYNILRTNAEQEWKRPVYFSVTTPASTHLNLEPYFQLEGFAHRVVPIRHDEPQGRVVPGLTDAAFADVRLTNLDDPDVHYGDTARGMVGTHYRLWPARAARGLAQHGRPERARRLLDRFTDGVPFTIIPADTTVRLQVAQAYRAAEASERVQEIARSTEPLVLDDLRTASGRQQVALALQQAGTLRSLYRSTGAQTALSRFDGDLQPVLDNLPMRLPEKVRTRFGLPGGNSAS
jgi:muconolactone delta-isomerase